MNCLTSTLIAPEECPTEPRIPPQTTPEDDSEPNPSFVNQSTFIDWIHAQKLRSNPLLIEYEPPWQSRDSNRVPDTRGAYSPLAGVVVILTKEHGQHLEVVYICMLHQIK